MALTERGQGNEYPFLNGTGEMARLTRSFSWQATHLGDPAYWPQSLKTTVGILLNSKFPMFLWWGDALTCFYNDAYRPSLGRSGKHPAILGMPAREAWPEIWDVIKPLIDQVLGGGEAVWKEDMLVPIDRNGTIEDVYWTFSYSPVMDETGRPAGVLVTCMETTGKVALIKELEVALAANVSAIAERKSHEEQLALMLNLLPAHVVVIEGKQQVVAMINNSNLAYWNRKKEDTLGKPLLEILPELADQPFPSQLDHVMETGEIISVKESPVTFSTPEGGERLTYVDYIYQPLTDASGKRTRVLVMSFEVTDKVESRMLLEKYARELQSVNEELAATNEELSATNEEMASVNEKLAKTNDELSTTQTKLKQSISELAASEARFRHLIQEAPVAIGVLTGRNMVIESANDMILGVWGKTKAIIGLTLEEALPELEGQPFLQLLDDVYTSGKPFYGNEVRAALEHERHLKELFFNFVYQPIQNEAGITTDIIVVAVDVTEQVNARKQVERTEESLRMAIDAAELGSYHMNTTDRIFHPSPRLKEFFGFGPDEDVPYEAAINQIHVDYRQAAADLIERAITTGIRFDMEYPVVGYHDGKTRWVRGLGEVQYDHDGKSYFTGVLHEITQKKLDEQRKDDFISIASHELKTPITSLKASLQILQRLKEAGTFNNMAPMIDQANKSLGKVSVLVEDLLNASNMNEGHLRLNKTVVHLADLARDCCQQLDVTGHQAVQIQGDGQLTVLADADRVEQVLVNLVNNAIKYAPESEQIIISIESIPGFARVTVTDQGPGIAAHQQGQLFNRYYQADTGNRYSGLGLGLYISAEIVKKHGGDIGVNSQPGKGSSFWFTLPGG